MSSAVLPSGLSHHDLRCQLDCLKATKPPYTCPISGCGRVYKSFSGIQSHLTKFKHESIATSGMEGVGSSAVVHTETRCDDIGGTSGQQRPGQQMSWTQAQKIIDVDVAGKIARLNILEPIPIAFVPSIDSSESEEKKPEMIPVPRAVFREIKDFEPSKMKTVPTTYIRYVEKTADDLDEEIEYDMDEEDDAWLELINERRLQNGWPRVSEATFEYVMNRLEKDSYFKTTPGLGPGHDGDTAAGLGNRIPHFEQDDDTVCCVCGDGECDNANAILFCDMCNLAVHQECYGVPYIPEGQWLCRRCQLSPSRGVDCRLCPNKGGAFKQTSDNGWAHVICALWVPEVQFANTVFLEPIEGFDRVPPARWKLTCYICKQKAKGACIQCHRPSCYTAFHVTCAQQAGLHMKMETVHDAKGPDGGVSIRKSAYCDAHAPSNSGESCASADERGKKNGFEPQRKSRLSEPPTLMPKFNMRRARKLLSQKRNLSPTVSVPVMPRRKLEMLKQQLRIAGKQEFLDRILRYWTLKRRSRFGVPLLRRLQVTHHASRMERERIRNKELQDQYNCWRQLRQDLEKARLLMELVRKREKKKKEDVLTVAEAWDKLLGALQRHLIATIDDLAAIDEERVFTQPVDEAEVPGYSRIIKSPMDLSTMRTKVERSEYKDFSNVEKDFELMMANCMKFNVQNEYFKSYGNKFKKKGLEILRQASQVYSQIKESRGALLTDLQRHSIQGDITAVTTGEKQSDAPTLSAKGATAKKAAPKKRKSSAGSRPIKIPNLSDSSGNMPLLTEFSSPAQQKAKSGQRSTSTKTPSSKPQKVEFAPLLSSEITTPSSIKPLKKKTPKAAGSAKKQAPKGMKKPTTPSSAPKKKKKPSAISEKGKRRKSQADDDEDDAKPLTSLLGQTPSTSKRANAGGIDKLRSPPKTPEMSRPSFSVFREDRRSPNSSAVESEIELASGDEGGYLRKKATLTMATSGQVTDELGLNQLPIEHLDFVWAHVEGKPWMPGVVIKPDIEYGPQAAVRFDPPAQMLDQKMDNAHLVMLFTETPSWVWLMRDALLMLGVDPEIDEKWMENAGSAQATVIQAYKRAHNARARVMGEDGTPDADDGDESGPPIIDEYRASGEGSDTSTSNSKGRSPAAGTHSGRTRIHSDASP